MRQPKALGAFFYVFRLPRTHVSASAQAHSALALRKEIIMVNVQLPDGSIRSFDQAVTIAEVAANIGPGLAKATLAGKVDGKLVDSSFRIESDSKLEIVTEKHADALDIVRHSTAHVLAQATQRLFPNAQVTIGPVVDNGFYYDFAYERAFTLDDLAAIEAEMAKIVAEALPVQRSIMA